MPVQTQEIPQAGIQTGIGAVAGVVQEAPLQLPQDEKIKKDLGLIPNDQLVKVVDPAITKMADEWVGKIMTAGNTKNPVEQENVRTAIEGIGSEIERSLAQKGKSNLLKEQLGSLVKSTEGSSVGKELLDLKVQVDRINPNQYRFFDAGGIGRFFGQIPGVGITVNKYFTKWQSAEGVIDSIINSIHAGAEILGRDNMTLREDQIQMRLDTIRLQKTIQVLMLADTKLAAKVNEMEAGSEERQFMEREILFALRQRIGDLQTTLSVNQSGVISYEFIVRTNRELIRGAHRCETTTKRALQIAVTQAIALMHQKQELEGVKAVDTVTENLMKQNAEQARVQGAEIYKQAANQTISVDTLRQVYTSIDQAFEDIAQFKEAALPAMAARIAAMDELSNHAEQKIRQLERGNAQRPSIEFNLETTGPANK